MIENFTKVVCVIRPIRLDCAPGGGGAGGRRVSHESYFIDFTRNLTWKWIMTPNM